MAFIWYELLTSDVAAAQRFYGSVIGWQVKPHVVEDYFEFGTGDAQVAGIMALPEEAGLVSPAWVGYIAVDDVDATVESVQSRGAAMCVPPTDIPDVGRFAMFLDPQRAPTYVMRLLPGVPPTAAFAAQPGHCQWNELVTIDPAGALTFYTRQFGWEKGASLPIGVHGEYQFLVEDGVQFGVIRKRARVGVPSAWRFYFGVEDIDHAARAVVAGGGRLLGEVQAVPSGAPAVVACDPQGAEFGISGPRPD